METPCCCQFSTRIFNSLDTSDKRVSGHPGAIAPFWRVNNFLNHVREELRHSMIKDSATIKNEGLTVRKHEEGTDEKIVASQDFQKEIIPHRNSEQAPSSNGAVMGNNDIARLLFKMEEDDDTFNLAMESRKEAAETVRQSRQDLIVVASLVERIPNLAGLTRTCEIFRASGLAVGDMGVVKDKQFRLISVTTEKWVPMVDVPVESVRAFLQRKRAEGYTVVGLEQTANSVALDEFAFPEKTVVVLGREKEGIRVDIIQEVVDVCVEIPQLVILRSLNVHVSAAIAIWDYTRQQRTRSSSSSLL